LGGEHDYFDVEHLKKDYKQRSIRGGALSVAGQAAKCVLHLASTMVLARLLTPRDFGLFAMVTAVIGFVSAFEDLGLSMATVQRPHITAEQVSTMFWINVGMSLAIALGIAAMAPAIAWFYGEPRLVPIAVALGFGFIVLGLATQHRALLRRNMRFGVLTAVDLASILTGTIVAVLMGLRGAGYWALVGRQLTAALVVCSSVWLACRWRPGLAVRGCGVRPMLTFGKHLVGHNVLNYFFRNLDNIIIGKFTGAFFVGLYSKAYALMRLPATNLMEPVATVAVPALCLLQNKREEYRKFYLDTIYYVTFVTMPIIVFMALFSERLVLLLLGSQWLQVAPFLRILCVSALYQPVTSTTGWLHVSSGRPDRMFKWRVRTVWLSVALFFVGVVTHGALGVAYAYTISVLILTVPCIWYAQKPVGIGTLNILRRTFAPLLASTLAGCCSLFVSRFTQNLALLFPVMMLAHLMFGCAIARSFSPVTRIYRIAERYLTRQGETGS